MTTDNSGSASFPISRDISSSSSCATLIETVWMRRMPAPGVSDDRVEIRPPGQPLQLRSNAPGRCKEHRRVPGTPRGGTVHDLAAGHAFDCGQNIADR